MEFPIETTDALFVDQLNHACKNPAYIELGGIITFGKKSKEGFWTYRVETHCVAITYVAKVLEHGPDGIANKYLVDSIEYEPC